MKYTNFYRISAFERFHSKLIWTPTTKISNFYIVFCLRSFRGQLVAHWFVTATKDIGDFYVYIRDQQNNIVFDRIVSYNNRRTAINGDEIVGSGSSPLELCVLAKSSSEEINFLESQCVRLPENLDAVKQKYNANHNYKLPLSLTSGRNVRSSSCDNTVNSVLWLVTVMVATFNWRQWSSS